MNLLICRVVFIHTESNFVYGIRLYFLHLNSSAISMCSKVGLGIWEIDANAGRLSVIRRRKMQTPSFCGGNATLSVFSVPISHPTPPHTKRDANFAQAKAKSSWQGQATLTWGARGVYLQCMHTDLAQSSQDLERSKGGWEIGELKCPLAVYERNLSWEGS